MTQQRPRASRQDPGIQRALFLAAAALQIGCGAVFLIDILSEMGRPTAHVLVEGAGIVALATGAAITLREYRRIARRNRRVERELDAVTRDFQAVVEGYFARWGLSEAERDVALLAIKGVSIADIARMRNTREGTIKAQNAAIYRKAGVSGRPELISVFVEELIAGLETGPGQDPGRNAA